MPEKRNFVIESSDLNKKVGTYFTGRAPHSAAQKAARSLFNEAPRRRKICFQLRETGTDILHHYKATCKKLKEPIVIERGGKQIKISKEYNVSWVARTKVGCRSTLYTVKGGSNPDLEVEGEGDEMDM